MKIIIDNDQPVSLIREQFNRMFPYLKLEFFSRLHIPGKTSALKQLRPWSSRLGELRAKTNTGAIEVRPEMNVRELEQLFGEQYGLGVQVFRRFGNGWLETGRTDSLTLNSLNALGKNDSLLICS